MPPAKPQEIVFFRGREVTIIGDARAFPLLIVNTSGELDIETYDTFFDWRTAWTDYAAATGTRIIQLALNDTLKPPNATVRKHMGDKVKNDAQIEGLIATYMVVPSALIRGVVTAVMWMVGTLAVKNFASLTEAVDAAHREFQERGLKYPPFDAATYTLPTENGR